MLSQDKPQDDDDTDYSLPLSQVMTSAIEEVKHQKQAFKSKYPRIRVFHVSNYQVQRDTLKLSYSRTDDDAALLGKASNKALIPCKYIEEMETLTRQLMLVASHSDWVLGSSVALLQQGDTGAVIRSIESLCLAQSHTAALLARLLANLVHVRQDQLVSTSALSSATKSSLLKLAMPLNSALFEGK